MFTSKHNRVCVNAFLALHRFSFSTSLSGSHDTSGGSAAGGTQTGDFRPVGGTKLWVCVWSLWLDNQTNLIADMRLSWLQEYETQSSPEARLVKQFDLLEMILQAHEYEELEGTPGRLQEFFDSTNGTFPAFLSFSYILLCVIYPVYT